jgi:hypothetical protein
MIKDIINNMDEEVHMSNHVGSSTELPCPLAAHQPP